MTFPPDAPLQGGVGRQGSATETCSSQKSLPAATGNIQMIRNLEHDGDLDSN